MVITLKRKKVQISVENVVSYYFTAAETFSWQAGQYLQWTLPQLPPANNQNQHWFTISTSPFEGEIGLTTRLSSSPFKTTLDSLPIGATIEVGQPSGDFVWQVTDQPKLFIAGGIGITPIRSMLWQRNQEGLPLDATLLYFNRSDNYIFKDELDTIADLKAQYLGGPVSVEAIKAAVADFAGKFIYLSGPEAMVESVGQALIQAGLPAQQLKQDWFPGYDHQNF